MEELCKKTLATRNVPQCKSTKREGSRKATHEAVVIKDYLESNLTLKQQFIKLQAITTVLSQKFTTLSIQQTLSKDDVPFIHIWKPISKYNGVQGMPFLPCFHIIVTLSTPYDDTDRAIKEHLLFQLHSFHGKVC